MKKNISELLLETLKQKQLADRTYSMRSLSRDLKLDSSQLYRVMGGKMKATPLVAYKLGKFLGLPSDEIMELIESTIAE